MLQLDFRQGHAQLLLDHGAAGVGQRETQLLAPLGVLPDHALAGEGSLRIMDGEDDQGGVIHVPERDNGGGAHLPPGQGAILLQGDVRPDALRVHAQTHPAAEQDVGQADDEEEEEHVTETAAVEIVETEDDEEDDE